MRHRAVGEHVERRGCLPLTLLHGDTEAKHKGSLTSIKASEEAHGRNRCTGGQTLQAVRARRVACWWPTETPLLPSCHTQRAGSDRSYYGEGCIRAPVHPMCHCAVSEHVNVGVSIPYLTPPTRKLETEPRIVGVVPFSEPRTRSRGSGVVEELCRSRSTKADQLNGGQSFQTPPTPGES